ncbi:hypothetical protein N7523_007727 [Penicillium sp. IBT 18751x]|nr:hypothetical protein N7523_007727 [Penicillium sp. IBT 18751x]
MSPPIRTDIFNVTSLFIDSDERLKRLLDRIADFSPRINEFQILIFQTPIRISQAATTTNASTASPGEIHSHIRPVNSAEEIRKMSSEIQALTRDIQAATGNIRTLGSKNQELLIRIDAYGGTLGSLSQSLSTYRRSFVAYTCSVLAVLSAIRPRTSILSPDLCTLASNITASSLHAFAGTLETPLFRDIQTLTGSLQDLTESAMVYMRSVSV